MATRKSFTKKERARLFGLYAGRCYLCSGAIDSTKEAYEIEHVIPWALTQDDSDANLRLVHRKCHAVKTAKDVGDIAKVYRMEAKHKGHWPKSKAKIPSRPFSSARTAS